jgi:hypothetical protein
MSIMRRNAIYGIESLLRRAGPAEPSPGTHADHNDLDSLESALQALGLNLADHCNLEVLVSDFEGLQLTPNRAQIPNPVPQLTENAAMVSADTMNHIDYYIFANFEFGTIQHSLEKRQVFMSLAMLLQIVATHRHTLAAVLTGAGNSIDSSTLPTPYRVRLQVYRSLARYPQVINWVLQERWQALEAAYRSAARDA